MLLQEEFISVEKKEEEKFREKTVQVVPHITNEIKDRMQLVIQVILILL
jgi:CTP synthase (UTP-ammonia lyase)